MQYCVTYSTCPVNGDYSKVISERLLHDKLAACVSIIDNVNSIYTWNGGINLDNEKLLIIKTKLSLFEQVKKQIEALHPYECPEIIAMPIIDGSKSYLKWIAETTK